MIDIGKGVGLYDFLSLMPIVFKFLGIIDWPWWLILFAMWGHLVIAGIVALVLDLLKGELDE